MPRVVRQNWRDGAMLKAGSLALWARGRGRGVRAAAIRIRSRTEGKGFAMTIGRLVKLSVVAGVALFMLSFVVPAGQASVYGSTEHCPDHEGHEGKVEVSDDFGSTLTLPEGTVFCVKAATGASGLLVSDGTPYEVTWLNGGGNTPDISYYVIYETPDDGGPDEDGPGEDIDLD